jgi:hypothetical protein
MGSIEDLMSETAEEKSVENENKEPVIEIGLTCGCVRS